MEKGYIIHEDSLRVTIATLGTSNEKTGNMVQVWILAKSEEPHLLVKNGGDSVVCGNCPLRSGNGCYVTVHQAPLSIYRSWKRGSYSNNYEEFLSVIVDRVVRFGAYGDPYFIPLSKLFQIANRCAGYTGYTHQWSIKGFDKDYFKILSASIDNQDQVKKLDAIKSDASYFRLVDDYSQMMHGEIICDADAFGIKCIDCLKCNGNSSAKVVIKKHGIKANKINTIAA